VHNKHEKSGQKHLAKIISYQPFGEDKIKNPGLTRGIFLLITALLKSFN